MAAELVCDVLQREGVLDAAGRSPMRSSTARRRRRARFNRHGFRVEFTHPDSTLWAAGAKRIVRIVALALALPPGGSGRCAWFIGGWFTLWGAGRPAYLGGLARKRAGAEANLKGAEREKTIHLRGTPLANYPLALGVWGNIFTLINRVGFGHSHRFRTTTDGREGGPAIRSGWGCTSRPRGCHYFESDFEPVTLSLSTLNLSLYHCIYFLFSLQGRHRRPVEAGLELPPYGRGSAWGTKVPLGQLSHRLRGSVFKPLGTASRGLSSIRLHTVSPVPGN